MSRTFLLAEFEYTMQHSKAFSGYKKKTKRLFSILILGIFLCKFSKLILNIFLCAVSNLSKLHTVSCQHSPFIFALTKQICNMSMTDLCRRRRVKLIIEHPQCCLINFPHITNVQKSNANLKITNK